MAPPSKKDLRASRAKGSKGKSKPAKSAKELKEQRTRYKKGRAYKRHPKGDPEPTDADRLTQAEHLAPDELEIIYTKIEFDPKRWASGKQSRADWLGDEYARQYGTKTPWALEDAVFSKNEWIAKDLKATYGTATPWKTAGKTKQQWMDFEPKHRFTEAGREAKSTGPTKPPPPPDDLEVLYHPPKSTMPTMHEDYGAGTVTEMTTFTKEIPTGTGTPGGFLDHPPAMPDFLTESTSYVNTAGAQATVDELNAEQHVELMDIERMREGYGTVSGPVSRRSCKNTCNNFERSRTSTSKVR